jgi:putative tryptophan/tyrosine transport system substrate-binding protein
MKAKILAYALLALFLATIHLAEAQQAKKVPLVGILFAATPSANSERIEAFRQGLRERGYAEGKDVLIEQRYADGNLGRLPALAGDLVHLNVDVIVSASSQGTRSLKEATNTIPIVMTSDTDPVGSKFVASLARPGGNITGLSILAPELGGKRLELLKESVPKLLRVAVLGTSTPTSAQVLREIEVAAAALKVQLQYVSVRGPEDIETAFREATGGRANGVLVLNSAILNSRRIQIVNLATRSRLPAMYAVPEYVEDGGLMSYSVSYTDLYRRAAVYVDKILKGAKPADLPVEQPTKFEFIINLKAAKQIGLTIPPNVLARADKVIK